MLIEAKKLRSRLEEAHALARSTAAQGGEDFAFDEGREAGLELALVMLSELEGCDGVMCVTESTGAHYRG